MLASAKQPTLVLDIFRNMYVVSFSMENNERNLQLVCLVLIFATELVSLPKYVIFFRETCSSYQNITENTKRVFGTPAIYEPIAKLGINSPIAKFIGPTWGRQDPGGLHVGPTGIAIWVTSPWTIWPPFRKRYFQMHFLN